MSSLEFVFISDVHYEFYDDCGRACLTSLRAAHPHVEMLVIGGDYCSTGSHFHTAIDMVCAQWGRVLFIPGNHEYYGSSRERYQASFLAAQVRNKNLINLHRHVVEIDGYRFVGATLWTPKNPRSWHRRKSINDFNLVLDQPSLWIPTAHDDDARFLRNNVRTGDVVVTHHLPSFACVSPRFRGSVLNDFFACDDMDDVVARQPALWLFGHTHDDMSVTAHGTKLMAAPAGYPHEGRAGQYVGLWMKLDSTGAHVVR